jgi:hypothetical protein
MKKISTVQICESEIFKEQRLTIGMDLGDHWSCYCVLDEAGKIILEQKVATTPEAMKQAFAKIPRSLLALETGTHSPWVSRLSVETVAIDQFLKEHGTEISESPGPWAANLETAPGHLLEQGIQGFILSSSHGLSAGSSHVKFPFSRPNRASQPTPWMQAPSEFWVNSR